MRVLIVDDDANARRAMERALRRFRYDVICADTGARGLEMMRSENPDVVLLDLIFPAGQMSGADVYREKMFDPEIRSIPVIVITGMSAEAASVGAESARRTLVGTTFVMTKPVDEHALAVAFTMLGGGDVPTCEPFPERESDA